MAEPIAAPRPLAAKWVKVNRQHHAEVQAEQEARGWESHDQYDGATLPLVPGRRFRVYGKPGWCYGPFTKNGADKVGCGTRVFKADRVAKVARRVGETEHEERVGEIIAGRKRKAA